MPTSLILIDAESKGMVGALGVWTPQEAHQPGARDDLTGPLPFGTRGKQRMVHMFNSPNTITTLILFVKIVMTEEYSILPKDD